MIAILAILMSLMVPALSGAKERARRAVCASNLRQFGICFSLYRDDCGALLETDEFADAYRRPSFIFAFGSSADRFLSAEALLKYLPGGFSILNEKTREVSIGGVWACPSAPKRSQKSYQDEITSWGGFTSTYSYFARVENWRAGQTTKPDMLTGNELLGDRLLMTDQLFHWWVDDGWVYSHGEKGPPPGGSEAHSPLGLAGLNQLYGDGHVTWKTGNAMKKETLSALNQECGFVRAYATDATFF